MHSFSRNWTSVERVNRTTTKYKMLQIRQATIKCCLCMVSCISYPQKKRRPNFFLDCCVLKATNASLLDYAFPLLHLLKKFPHPAKKITFPFPLHRCCGLILSSHLKSKFSHTQAHFFNAINNIPSHSHSPSLSWLLISITGLISPTKGRVTWKKDAVIKLIVMLNAWTQISVVNMLQMCQL